MAQDPRADQSHRPMVLSPISVDEAMTISVSFFTHNGEVKYLFHDDWQFLDKQVSEPSYHRADSAQHDMNVPDFRTNEPQHDERE
ncbi:hypothetical protein E4U59_000610 [Claviceps monticola]|nr:hypothetical protein E4U59_000610 [Claviceps monticola]